MRLPPRSGYLKYAHPRQRPRRGGTRCAGCSLVRARLSLEELEDRNMPSTGPVPIPGSSVPMPNPFGGPDVHFRLPGPADSTHPRLGGEPSTITNFNGFIGVVQVE